MIFENIERSRKTGAIGLAGVFLFGASLFVFGKLNAGFDFINDFVSKLGASGEPNAIWWNLIGFALVGFLQIGFGISYGNLLNDKLTGLLLALFGVGLIFTAVPIDMIDSVTTISKVHIVAICLAVAFWLFGLSRISYLTSNKNSIRNRANVTAILIVTAMIGFAAGLWKMPITHKMVFAIVFGWTAVTSLELLFRKKQLNNSNL